VTLLNTFNVQLRFLPTYSPELNPCELVFAEVKGWLRHRRGSDPFWFEILKAFQQVSFQNVLNYYFKCLGV